MEIKNIVKKKKVRIIIQIKERNPWKRIPLLSLMVPLIMTPWSPLGMNKSQTWLEQISEPKPRPNKATLKWIRALKSLFQEWDKTCDITHVSGFVAEIRDNSTPMRI